MLVERTAEQSFSATYEVLRKEKERLQEVRQSIERCERDYSILLTTLRERPPKQ